MSLKGVIVLSLQVKMPLYLYLCHQLTKTKPPFSWTYRFLYMKAKYILPVSFKKDGSTSTMNIANSIFKFMEVKNILRAIFSLLYAI